MDTVSVIDESAAKFQNSTQFATEEELGHRVRGLKDN